MALGVERSAVGDILIEEGRCVAFVRSELLLYFESNLTAVGKAAVAMTEGFDEPLPSADSFAELSGVVASQRLDGIVAFLMRTSREKAANFPSITVRLRRAPGRCRRETLFPSGNAGVLSSIGWVL